jgi:pilus assembly protein CpaB
MKPKTIILMVVAVGCGLAASYMTAQLLAERETTEAAPPAEKVTILVAKHNLDIGLTVKDPAEHFKEKTLLKGEEPAKALTKSDFESLRNKQLIHRLTAEQFVSAEDLIDKDMNGLASRLPKGHVAVGIKVDSTATSAGLASMPFSRVDIISVLRRGDDDSSSQTILENVLVLAAGAQTQRPDGTTAIHSDTVTVALRPEDAELVALAQEMGSLRLVLRAEGDTTIRHSHGVEGSRIRKRLLAQRGNDSKEPATNPSRPTGPLVTDVPDVDPPKKPAKKAPAKKAAEPEKKTVVVVKKEPEKKTVEPEKKQLEPEKKQPEPEKKTAVVEAPKAPPEPTTFTHVLTIYNGDQGRRVAFTVDKQGKVVNDDITQPESEEAATPPVKKHRAHGARAVKPRS